MTRPGDRSDWPPELHAYYAQRKAHEAEQLAKLHRANAAARERVNKNNLQRMAVAEARYYAHLTPKDETAHARGLARTERHRQQREDPTMSTNDTAGDIDAIRDRLHLANYFRPIEEGNDGAAMRAAAQRLEADAQQIAEEERAAEANAARWADDDTDDTDDDAAEWGR